MVWPGIQILMKTPNHLLIVKQRQNIVPNLNISGTYYCYDRYYYLKNSGSPDEVYGIAPLFAGEFDYYLGLKTTWLAFGKSRLKLPALSAKPYTTGYVTYV